MSENKRRQVNSLVKKAPRKNRKKRASFNGFVGIWPVLKAAAVLAVLLTVSGCFVVGYECFVRSASLRITDIEVEGTCLLSREAVLARARIRPGENILAANLSVARRRLLADPWIAEAWIIRELPSKIVIGVREHAPVAIVDCGEKYLINTRRELFKRAESADPTPLPVICGVGYDDLDAAGRPAGPVLNAALDVIDTVAAIGRRVPGVNVRRVVADRDMGLTLHAFGAIDEVRLGFDDENDNYLNKFRRLNYMLVHCLNQGGGVRLAAAGLEYPGRVVVRTAAGDAVAAIIKGGNHAGTGNHRRS